MVQSELRIRDYSMYGKKNGRFPFLFKKDTATAKCTWIFVLSKKNIIVNIQFAPNHSSFSLSFMFSYLSFTRKMLRTNNVNTLYVYMCTHVNLSSTTASFLPNYKSFLFYVKLYAVLFHFDLFATIIYSLSLQKPRYSRDNNILWYVKVSGQIDFPLYIPKAISTRILNSTYCEYKDMTSKRKQYNKQIALRS